MDYDIIQKFFAFFILLIIWSGVWKGLALWRAARLKSIPWFVALLILNTVGILEIIYLLISRDEMAELKKAEESKK